MFIASSLKALSTDQSSFAYRLTNKPCNLIDSLRLQPSQSSSSFS